MLSTNHSIGSTHPTHTPAGWMNTQAAADYLGISPRTVRWLKDEGRLSYAKIGRRVLYRQVDLDAALIAATQPATKPLNVDHLRSAGFPGSAR